MIKVNCDVKETLNISELTEFQGDLKHRDDNDVSKIIKSIKKHGFAFPFFVWKHDDINHVFDGHGRLMALKLLQEKGEEIPPLPVVYVNAKDEAEAKEMLLKLNSNYGHMTKDSVLEFLDGLEIELEDLELPDTTLNFEIESEPEETEEELEDEEIPEEQEEVVSEFGEIYQLGDSFLMCGDSTNEEDVARLMNGQKADLVFTDPPYGMKKENEGVANDNLNYDDLLEFNKKWIPLSFKYTKENGSWYCWGIDEPLMDIYSNILKPMQNANKITFRNFITWKKENDNPTMLFNGACSEGFRKYYSNEKCLFVMKGVQGFNNNSDHYDETFEPIRKYLEDNAKAVGLTAKKLQEIVGVGMYAHWFTKSQFGIIPEQHYLKLQEYYKDQAFPLAYNDMKNLFDAEKYKTLKEAIMEKRAFFDGTKNQNIDVWVSDVTSGKEKEEAGGHATPKPFSICRRGIEASSRENEIVLDLFGGSGSTLIACEKLNRKARLMELNPHYCDVIRRRYTQWAKENNRPITSGCLE